MRTNAKLILEAKADRDRFKAWAGEDLFNRFLNIKDRLVSPENDMTYWTSTRTPRQKSELMTIIKRKEEEISQKEQEKKLIRYGAKILFQDENWLVYAINNFEACQKYGAGTKWCITGKNMDGDDVYGRKYWDSYTRDGNEFFFFLKKGSNEKFAVMIDEGREHTIFDPQDREIPFIENAPKVDGLPDVSQNNPKYKRDENEEPAGPPVPPPFNLEPVQNPQAMEFVAATLEDALNRFSGVYGETALKVEDLRQDLFAIRLGNGKFTIFVFNGTAGGPLMTQRGPGQFALVTFDNLEVLTTWFQANMASVQVQNQAQADQPQAQEQPEEE
jgi:hypothetical protein